MSTLLESRSSAQCGCVGLAGVSFCERGWVACRCGFLKAMIVRLIAEGTLASRAFGALSRKRESLITPLRLQELARIHHAVVCTYLIWVRVVLFVSGCACVTPCLQSPFMIFTQS